jgi:hypothetical protein
MTKEAPMTNFQAQAAIAWKAGADGACQYPWSMGFGSLFGHWKLVIGHFSDSTENVEEPRACYPLLVSGELK